MVVSIADMVRLQTGNHEKKASTYKRNCCSTHDVMLPVTTIMVSVDVESRAKTTYTHIWRCFELECEKNF